MTVGLGNMGGSFSVIMELEAGWKELKNEWKMRNYRMTGDNAFKKFCCERNSKDDMIPQRRRWSQRRFSFCAFLKLGNTKTCLCADGNNLLERKITDDIRKKD